MDAETKAWRTVALALATQTHKIEELENHVLNMHEDMKKQAARMAEASRPDPSRRSAESTNTPSKSTATGSEPTIEPTTPTSSEVEPATSDSWVPTVTL